MLLAHVCTFWIAVGGLLYKKAPPTLNFSIDNCNITVLDRVNMTQVLARQDMMRAATPDDL